MRQRQAKRKSDSWMDLYKKNIPEETELELGTELPHGPVLFYNELVADHSTNPRNVGEIYNADGFAHLGDPTCGDWMKLWIKVNADRIVDIKFLSSGCAGAIATSSMTTVLAKGKTIKEAKRITDADVILALEGIPGRDGKCILSGTSALHEAIRNYEQKNGGSKENA
ncbi:MAG TPA: iron-sulfur cluster assembly scaffold protein [Syntrophales bacterium]|nr:iron-sulfur cluster assembly scaffold protein [Syntrophales bacterium]